VSHRVVFTPEAQDDLLDLYDYIADPSSPTRALRGATICVPDCV
jgi:plasmid stabilization system protein ParE